MYRKLRCLPCLLLITTFSMAASLINVGVEPGKPSRLETLQKLNFTPKIPEHCQNQTLCGDVPNYPKDYIDDLLRRNSTIVDVISLLGGLGTPEGCLNDQDPNDMELCPSTIGLLLVSAGRDSNGQWYFLVSRPWLCVEICKNPGGQCSQIPYVPREYQATCEQKHIKQRSLALDSNGDVKYITVTIQSACCCHVRSSDQTR